MYYYIREKQKKNRKYGRQKPCAIFYCELFWTSPPPQTSLKGKGAKPPQHLPKHALEIFLIHFKTEINSILDPARHTFSILCLRPWNNGFLAPPSLSFLRNKISKHPLRKAIKKVFYCFAEGLPWRKHPEKIRLPLRAASLYSHLL